MANNTESPNYYAIIPANVRYDTELPANAKLLYGEITALCNAEGYCWASNKYFAGLYNTTTRAVSRWLKALSDKGYIESKLQYKQGSKEVETRYITISGDPIDKNVSTYRQNCPYPIDKNVSTPIDKNVVENNTLSFNTTSNNFKKESKTSYDAILSKIQDDSLKELYLEYIKMRKMIKSPMTDKALQMLINKVERLEPTSIDRQKLLLETAILNNWKSVYPLKDETSQPTARRETVPSWLKNKETSLDRDELETIGLEGYIKPQTSAEELKQRLKEKYGKGDKH